MFGICWNLLLNLALSIALGIWLTPSWFKYVELIGVAALIGHTILSIQNHQDKNKFLINLETNLFFIGCGLILCLMKAASSIGFNMIIGCLILMFFYPTLSATAEKFSDSLNRFQLGCLLYVVTEVSIGIGYLCSIYFNFRNIVFTDNSFLTHNYYYFIK